MVTINVCFHGVGRCSTEREPGEARYWMATEVFLRVLDELADEPHVALSFDDGNRSDVDIALPALRERGMKATFFALAGRLNDPSSLSGSDLRELRRAGMSIGNHGWTHAPWRGLSDTTAQRELNDSRSVLATASGGAITDAALPLGRYDRGTLRRLREAGYQAVYTSDRYPSADRSWLRARYSVTSSDDAGSVSRIARRRARMPETRNVAASMIKRFR